MSKTIDEILMSLVEKVAPDEDGLSQHKGLEPQDLAEDKAIQTSKQAIATMVQEIIGSNDYIPSEDVDGLVNNNRLVRDGLRHEQRLRAVDLGIPLDKEKL